MSDFKIEKGIPAPPERLRYPFREMKVGDSFFVPCSDEEKRRVANRMRSSASKRRGLGAFSLREVEGGVRAWKIEEENNGGG